MAYIITEACIGVKDRACVDVCPVDCIYEGADMVYINPDECIECGARDDRGRDWKAYVTTEDTLLVYCAVCAEREFGD